MDKMTAVTPSTHVWVVVNRKMLTAAKVSKLIKDLALTNMISVFVFYFERAFLSMSIYSVAHSRLCSTINRVISSKS